MDQKQQLEELFDKWRNKPNHNDTFIKDGIINLSAWINKQKPKVLSFYICTASKFSPSVQIIFFAKSLQS